jgi:hypothetical protein
MSTYRQIQIVNDLHFHVNALRQLQDSKQHRKAYSLRTTSEALLLLGTAEIVDLG